MSVGFLEYKWLQTCGTTVKGFYICKLFGVQYNNIKEYSTHELFKHGTLWSKCWSRGRKGQKKVKSLGQLSVG